MKGFKPTGHGMSSGFKYPSHMGFTGSTGGVMSVSGYTRRKFADGGFVRQDTPRMQSGSLDEGSALVRRARSSTDLDEVSGGKTPIRPGYKKGGKMKKMKKADGGYVPRRTNAYTLGQSIASIPAALKELMRSAGKKTVSEVADKGTGATISGRQKQIDDYVDEAQTGSKTASNYASGGRTRAKKKMAMGGGLSQALAQAAAMRGPAAGSAMPGNGGTPAMAMGRRDALIDPRARPAPPAPPWGRAPPPRMQLPTRPGVMARYAKGGATKKLLTRC